MLNEINYSGIPYKGDHMQVPTTTVVCPNCLMDHKIKSYPGIDPRQLQLCCDDCNAEMYLTKNNLIDLQIPFSD